MKSDCGRFEFKGELGILDSLSCHYITLEGEIIQIKGMREVQFSDATKNLLMAFIEQLKPHLEILIKESRQKRLKSNFFIEFNRNLNEGYY